MSSVCRLDPIGLEPLFVRVCFRRCHCAPSMFNGPDGKSMVAIPCVVVAMVEPLVGPSSLKLIYAATHHIRQQF